MTTASISALLSLVAFSAFVPRVHAAEPEPQLALVQPSRDFVPPPASGPTSGSASFLSGRTMDNQLLIAGAVGWPGAWAHFEWAPVWRVNVGFRLAGNYGSPIMGLTTGGSGELSVPVRVHLLGDTVDVALRITPRFALGEGRAFGEQTSTIRSDELGYAGRLDVGARIGWQLDSIVTLFGGLDAGLGFSGTSESARVLGIFTATVGVEALLARDFMLFGELDAGVGVADDSGRAVAFYPQREVLRVALGLAFLLT